MRFEYILSLRYRSENETCVSKGFERYRGCLDELVDDR